MKGIVRSALTRIQLIIFDLDGTLVDSKRDLCLSVNAMRESMGRVPLSDDVIASYVGRGVSVLVRRALGEQATDVEVEKAKAIFLSYYRQHMLDNTRLYSGAREAIEELRPRRFAVLTNKPLKFSRAMLEGLGVVDLFSFIYGGDSFARKKPDPVGVNRLISDTGLSPDQTLMVGDSDTDILAGHGAGAWTCGVTYGLGAHTLENALPDFVLGDLLDLPLLLNHRGNGRS